MMKNKILGIFALAILGAIIFGVGFASAAYCYGSCGGSSYVNSVQYGHGYNYQRTIHSDAYGYHSTSIKTSNPSYYHYGYSSRPRVSDAYGRGDYYYPAPYYPSYRINYGYPTYGYVSNPVYSYWQNGYEGPYYSENTIVYRY